VADFLRTEAVSLRQILLVLGDNLIGSLSAGKVWACAPLADRFWTKIRRMPAAGMKAFVVNRIGVLICARRLSPLLLFSGP